MDTSLITAGAALVGAVIGGLTSLFTSWLTQRAQARASWLTHSLLRRQDLYREFIENAAKCYADALQHDEADIPDLIGLYSKIDQMRIMSSPEVVACAIAIRHRILKTFIDQNRSFGELREMMAEDSIDLLSEFGDTCRAELERLSERQFRL